MNSRLIASHDSNGIINISKLRKMLQMKNVTNVTVKKYQIYVFFYKSAKENNCNIGKKVFIKKMFCTF